MRRAVAEGTPTKISRHIIMVLGVVAGLKNGELVMAGVVGGDCRDKMADRLPRSCRWCGDFELYLVVNRKPVEVTVAHLLKDGEGKVLHAL